MDPLNESKENTATTSSSANARLPNEEVQRVEVGQKVQKLTMEEFRLRDEADVMLAEFSLGGYGAGESNNPLHTATLDSTLFCMGVGDPDKPIPTKWKKNARAKGQRETRVGNNNNIIGKQKRKARQGSNIGFDGVIAMEVIIEDKSSKKR